jgi:hypothetical protein
MFHKYPFSLTEASKNATIPRTLLKCLLGNLKDPAQTTLRSEGKDLCWLQLMIERDRISQVLHKELVKDATGPLTLANLKNVSFSTKHVEIPPKLLDSINEPAVQRILMEA